MRARALCVRSSVLLRVFYLYLSKGMKSTKIERKQWGFSPLTVNAKMINQDSEVIFKVCIYVFNFSGAGSWDKCAFPYPGCVNHYFPCGRVNSQWDFLGFCEPHEF